MFKTRNKKIYAGDSRVTLDARHQAIVSQLTNTSSQYQDKQNELKELQKQIDDKKQFISSHPGIPLIQEYHDLYQLEGQLENLNEEMEDLSKNKGAQDYFLKTGDLLCQYYQHLDHVAEKNTSNEEDIIAPKKRGRPVTKMRNVKTKGKRNFSWMENTTTRGTNILSFFQQPTTPVQNESDHDSGEEEKTPVETPIDDEAYPSPNIDVGADFDRATALQQYLQEVDPNYSPPKPPTWMVDFCPLCLQKDKIRRELILQSSDGVLTCQVCGHMAQVVIDSEKPSYKDPPPEATYFAYKRINHYNEWLNQIQAKESTEIPPEVYQYILEEIRKERITDLATLTNEKVRTILKKLRLNKYYEHIPHIINKLNGLPPPILTREVEEKLRVMFREIQGPFLEVCPKDRKNFLSYSYTLHKCVELLGLDEYKSLFPLLKSREKLHKTDLLWAQICAKLGWTFYKSI